MNEKEAIRSSIELMEIAEAAYLTTIDNINFPQTRSMFNLRNREQFPGLSKLFSSHRDDFLVYFTTNTSSAKMSHIGRNRAVSVYYCKPDEWRGLMLSGTIEIATEPDIKKSVWQEGWEMYYPGGVDDPDYTILYLYPMYAKYYHQLNVFKIDLKP